MLQRLKFFGKRRFILGLIVLIIAVCAVFRFIVFPQKAPVEKTVAKRGNLVKELTLSGTIDADEHVTLQFQTVGQLAWVGVKNGDWVKKSQLIASLDKQKLEAALRQSWQDFTAAKAASEKVYDSLKNVSAENFDQKISRTAADATQNKAYDDIKIAEQNLKYADLYSPFDGIVVNANPSYPGVNITATNPGSYEIVNPETIFFDVTADQTEVTDLKEGDFTTIILDSYPNNELKAEIKNISFTPKKDETETVYQVKLTFEGVDNKNYDFRLGMTGDATFVTAKRDNVVYLPLNFVKSDDRGKYVLLGNNKKKTYIKTGLETETDIEIVEGLNAGDSVYD